MTLRNPPNSTLKKPYLYIGPEGKEGRIKNSVLEAGRQLSSPTVGDGRSQHEERAAVLHAKPLPAAPPWPH